MFGMSNYLFIHDILNFMILCRYSAQEHDQLGICETLMLLKLLLRISALLSYKFQQRSDASLHKGSLKDSKQSVLRTR
jgi:hypothetical protein